MTTELEGGNGESDHNLVLVIDDETMISRLLCRFLAMVGFESESAETAVEALRLAEEHAADIAFVVMDFNIPGSDGVTLYRELRALVRGPVVVTSGDLEKEVASQLGEPDVLFLPKPFGRDHLENLIDRIREEEG